MTYSGLKIWHRDIHAEYIILLVSCLDDYDDCLYQAFSTKQLTHRLWPVPVSEEYVESQFRCGRIERSAEQ